MSVDPNSRQPRISIVTPSFNQGAFIEETLRSVLEQDYPNAEYLVMDGGSRDETVSILRKYEGRLAGWVSEKDGGQADAINKGWARTTGEIVAYINSDDCYLPGAFHEAAGIFEAHPEVQWLAGSVHNGYTPQESIKVHISRPTSLVECMGRRSYGFHQPGMFWRRSLIESVGPFDTSLHYSFCHDFWIRSLLKGFTPHCVEKRLAFFRLHPRSKSCSGRHRFLEEDRRVFDRYAGALSDADRKAAALWLKQYEMENLLDAAYELLAEGKPAQARRLVGRNLRHLGMLNDKRPVPGLLFRVFCSGKPPAWHCA